VALLEVKNLISRIGELQILNGVDLNIEEGEKVAVLGRNGAGKTTLIRSIVGLIKTKSGKIIFKGEDITHVPPYEITKRGISYVPSERGIFGGLTVSENLKLSYSSKSESLEKKLKEVISLFPFLEKYQNIWARQLSGGQQKLLSIACAFMRDFDLLILDELSEGLSPLITKEIYNQLIGLHEKKKFSLLIVEQNASVVRNISDRMYIMDKGKIVASFRREELARNEAILMKYLGIAA